jgi:biotin synthase
MSDELQALCFLAGANSIFHGEKLLTTGNPDTAHDLALFTRLGIHAMPVEVTSNTVHADIVERSAADAAA